MARSPIEKDGLMPLWKPVTLEDRVKTIWLAQNDLAFRADFNKLVATDARAFFNYCLWVNEPRAGDGKRDVPFLLRQFQNEYIRLVQWHITNDQSLLTDKTREMGVTWQLIGMGLWGWLFQHGFTMLCGSITEDKIDGKNNPNTLFWKFDYLLESLKWQTPWLHPDAYNPKVHRSHMKAANPEKRSMMLGEPMGANFGRSGRVKVILLDEFAEAQAPVSTWAACSRSTNCRLVVFTPKGMNFAGRLANPAKGRPRTITRISLHWMLDESKNAFEIHDARNANVIIAEGHGRPDPAIYDTNPHALPPIYPWYEEAKKAVNYDPVLIAQELDVNYNESVEGQMYPQIERAGLSRRVHYNPSLTLYCAMDYGLGDMMALVWFQYDPFDKRFKIIDAYQNRGKTIRWYVPFITGENLGLGTAEGGYTPADLEVIDRHRAYAGKYTDYYGDPAGKQRNPVTATSVITTLADYGIYVRTNDKAVRYDIRVQYLAPALPFCDFDSEYCNDLVQAIRDSRYNPLKKPVHGPESHFRSALEYGFVNQPHGIIGQRALPESYLLPGNVAIPADVAREAGLMGGNRSSDPYSRLRQIRLQYDSQEEVARRLQEARNFGGGNGNRGGILQRGQSGGWGKRRN
jgi:hypothetical protein